MSLQPQAIPPIPEETAHVARSLHPKGNRYMWLREQLGTIYHDEQFATLYPGVGQLAEQPWRIALMSVIQYMEGYTDRQAAEAMKERIDIKYALSLELTDPGFDFSVLSEFRSRLIERGLEEVLLTSLLELCRQRGWLKERTKQRTDSTHVQAAIRTMNRIECVGETVRATLNILAAVVPEWLRAHVPQEWYERYVLRIEEFRMPKGETTRQGLVEQIGQDGWQLLIWVRQEEAPQWLREIPAVEILRQVWVQQFWVEEGKLHWRSNESIPPSALLISSPYDIQAHLSIKRDTVWTGYKVHMTETCEEHSPHLLVHVETTLSTTQDIEMTNVIHQQLERKHLLPSEHLMDTGYVDGEHIVTSQKQYEVELLGPVVQPGNWQAKDAQGFDLSHFVIDWHHHTVTCPEGKISRKWTVRQERTVPEVIRAQFAKRECLACPSRSQCPQAKENLRQVTFRPQAHHEAIQAARKRQTTQEFKERYAKRSGIEGTISQGVRAFDLRTCRYLGIQKTHLQHLLTATAMNVVRLFQWQMGQTPVRLPLSPFAVLAP